MNLTERHIQILPDFIANQIAAGEVVQRPESVIKELVENSLDAGADTICVVVRGSGKKLIHIVDNGCGMSREDLSLALKRHATSKIRTQEDLQHIMSLGFRGEALASIGSVAQVEIRTRREEDSLGWKLLAEPMKEEQIEAVNTEKGTQIFVKNLFYNVPARRKFLRSDLTEFRYISDTMMKFALSRPDVRFTFYDDDSLIFDVHPSGLGERITALLGNVQDSLIKALGEGEGLQVSGYIGKPALAKQSRAGQHFFLNGRAITSRSLNHAVFSAFEHILDKSQHPFFVLNLEIDPERVDVNVHPQKHEVKFEDERSIYNLVQHVANEALRSASLVPELVFRGQAAQSPFEKLQFGSAAAQNEESLLVNRLTGEIIEPAQRGFSGERNFSGNTSPGGAYPTGRNSSGGNFPFPPRTDNTITQSQMSAFEALFGGNPGQPAAERQEETPSSAEQKQYWQLHNKYIFIQSDKGMTVIDQHNAHERILYERALAAMNKNFSYGQKLLFPAEIRLNPSEESLVRELEEELHGLGYDFTLNENIVELRGVPGDVKSGAEEESLRELLEQYQEYEKIRHTEKRDNLAASFACKSAVKTGQALSFAEMKKLADDLFACATPTVCPHGRPVMIDFDLREFDRRFGRSS